MSYVFSVFCYASCGENFIMNNEQWNMDVYGRDVKYIYFYSYVLGLYISYSWMYQLSTSFEEGNVLEYITGLDRGVKSHMNLNIDLTHNFYFELWIWNLDLQPSYNRCIITIWLVWWFNLILYNHFSWNSSTLNSSQYKNCIIRK